MSEMRGGAAKPSSTRFEQKGEVLGRRPYRQTTRAAAVRETRKRILMAFWDFAQTRWLDDITLEEVAARSRVTVRTVIRQFGGKDGLLAEIPAYLERNTFAQHGPWAENIDTVIDKILVDYEEFGDASIRALAQQVRHPALLRVHAQSSEDCAEKMRQAFRPWLDQLPSEQLQTVLDALVVATDVYSWKRLRRDMGRSEGETRMVFRFLVNAVLDQMPKVART